MGGTNLVGEGGTNLVGEGGTNLVGVGGTTLVHRFEGGVLRLGGEGVPVSTL